MPLGREGAAADLRGIFAKRLRHHGVERCLRPLSVTTLTFFLAPSFVCKRTFCSRIAMSSNAKRPFPGIFDGKRPP